jgi:NAD+ synthase (glutamine-hydrolysing)
LEDIIHKVTGQRTVPIGDAVISTLDTSVGCETCEELFTPLNPSTYMGFEWSRSYPQFKCFPCGAEKTENTSRAYHQHYTQTRGCLCVRQCDRCRWRSTHDVRWLVNDSPQKVLDQGSQFSLKEVEVITATIDVEEIRSARASSSRNIQAAAQPEYERIECELRLSRPADEIYLSPNLEMSREIEIKVLEPMEEIYMSTAVFLWQHFVRTNSAGYFLALSGGLDSCTMALMVFGMARLVLQSVKSGDKKTLADLRRVTGEETFILTTPQEIVSRLFHTCYMGTKNSSEERRSRARGLAETLGAFHSDISFDEAILAHEGNSIHSVRSCGLRVGLGR